jgi:hypothetical protein
MAAKKWKTGKRAGTVRVEKREIPYNLEEFKSWLRVTLEDHPFCEYCKCSISLMTISPDHATPVKRGGSLERKNLRGACSPCNRLKGELLPGEFKTLIACIGTFTEHGRNDVVKRLKGGILHFGSKRKEPVATNVLAIPAPQSEELF